MRLVNKTGHLILTGDRRRCEKVGAHVILLRNVALICFIDPILKACVSPSSEGHQRELSRLGNCTICVFPQRRYQHIRVLEAG